MILFGHIKTTLAAAVLLSALLSLYTPLHAQDIRYQSDSTCGCDIRYVNGFETIRDGDLYGFRRYDGTVIAEPIYKYVAEFDNEGYCRVWMADSLCGLIDSTGRQVIPCIYHGVGTPSCNRIHVLKNNMSGYTDLNGNVVIPLRYPMAYPFTDNRAAVAVILDSFLVSYTFIDTLGNQLFPPTYEDAHPFSQGIAPIKRFNLWGLIDTLGHEILPTAYEIITPVTNGTFLAGDPDGCALFNLSTLTSPLSTLKPLTPFQYIPLSNFHQGRIGVARNGKQGFLDSLGNEIIPCIYDEIGIFHLGRTLARQGDKYGIIDTLGHTILPLLYDNRTPQGIKYMYYDSLALVEQEGHLGYVDLLGNIAIPLIFDEAYPFSEGLAPVLHNGHWGYIDTHGDIYLPFIFDFASPFRHQRAEVYFNGQPYTIDHNGRCVHNCNGIISFR